MNLSDQEDMAIIREHRRHGRRYIDRVGFVDVTTSESAQAISGVLTRDIMRMGALEQALKEIRAKAAFELSNPTGLERTCLSIIRKTADEALEVPDELK